MTNKRIVSVELNENSFLSTSEIVKWLKSNNDQISVYVEKIPFSKLDQWSFEKNTGNLVHESGKFFSIEGVRVDTNFGEVSRWEQPIINQPEVGILGIICKEINGILHFLLQAKIEPGNINHVQLSPTLQATKSNFTLVHKGKSPNYLEYFRTNKYETIVDQLQSEQGARFFKKRNRNIIIKINEDIEVKESFCWLTLGQIKHLIHYDNIINMDTRTVISGLPCQRTQSLETLDPELCKRYMFSFNDLLSWITNMKTMYELCVRRISLSRVNGWIHSENTIHHNENKYFNVIATEVKIGNREVAQWTQPMIEPRQSGLISFVVKKINGIYHFIVQAKVEIGNFDIIELAPTVQCITGNYKETGPRKLPFLEYVLNARSDQIVYDVMQSEEGGRFFREQNRNMIVIADENFPTNTPNNYIWMSYQQLHVFLMFNNYLNIQARSILAAITICDEEIS